MIRHRVCKSLWHMRQIFFEAISKVRMPPAMLLLFTVALCFQCSHETSREAIIVGKWKACWKTSGNALSNLSPEDLMMEGRMEFDNKRLVVIQAYGHEGCIFSSDTLTHQLNWKLDGNTLRFIDNKEDHGLPYTIQTIKEKTIELKLLEDIYLTLEK